ncbi:MAG TPA: S41 family peptidase [Candidatus Sulfopaludibacter sp.]|jgi:hypothetical protein|nr:S41 family peptidase [Candidatus Sulfopaludibacter sp.]
MQAPVPPAPVFRAEDASSITTRAWDILLAQKNQLGLTNLAIQPFADFLAAAEQNPTTAAERQIILDQAILLFRNLYPHMPFKTDIYHFLHPADYLAQAVIPQFQSLGESDFHDFIVAAFSLVRDAHSLYGKPSPFRGSVAFLPFQMRPYTDETGRVHYIVASVMAGFDHPAFAPGAEILAWGQEPIENHVQRAAARLPGGNLTAARTRGAIHCTVRPLTFVQVPFADELPSASLTYLPIGGTHPQAISMPWAAATGFAMQTGFPNTAYSMSSLSLASFECGKILQWKNPSPPPDPNDHNAVSQLPNVFEFLYTKGPLQQGYINLSDLICPAHPDARFGYIRIKGFSDGQASLAAADRIVNEFQRILTLMDEVAQDGLVIDIRGNPGGEVAAAERMLQMLTPGPITPQRFHLANTPAMLTVLANIKSAASKTPRTPADDSKLTDAKLELGPWLDDAANTPFPAGDRLTSGQPLTSPALANDTGQIYQGRVMLMVDGLTYSAADIFAAGFQDHAIGHIIGPDATTGGGGATLWSHSDLRSKLGPSPGVALQPLPRDTSMSLAVRRCSRVVFFDGQPVEDVGVKVDVQFAPVSVADVLEGYPSIVRRACVELEMMAAYRLDNVKPHINPDGSVNITLTAKTTSPNQQDAIHSLVFYLNGHQALSAAPGQPSYTVPAVPGIASPATLRIEAHTAVLVAVRNLSLLDPTPPSDDSDDGGDV